MALFKKKPKPDAEAQQEWEQTLVAEESDPSDAAASDAAVLSNEPPAPEPEPDLAMEPEPTPSWAPEPAPEPEPAVAADLQPHVGEDEQGLFLKEHRFDRPTKMALESRVTTSPRTALAEKAWHPAHRTSLKALHDSVDRLKIKPARLVGDGWLKTQFKPRTETTRREVIPGNILSKRVVYETEGGFVVEVTFREGGETRKKFFTVNTRGGRRKALETIQSGKYALTTIVGDGALQDMGRPKGKTTLETPAGQVNTYPITNLWDVNEIEGIGEVYARRLHELGIHSTDQLRLTNATVIANNLGISPPQVEKWQQMSELLVVKGIGKQIAEALVRTGVASIDDLKTRKPKELSQALGATIASSQPRIMRGGINAKRAWSLILSARNLKKTVQPFPVVET